MSHLDRRAENHRTGRIRDASRHAPIGILRHYPIGGGESPVANVLWPKIRGNPAARVFKGDMEVFGDAKEFPYAATSYRLTEHFHFWTKHNQVNASLQPEFFVEISEQLRQLKQAGPP